MPSEQQVGTANEGTYTAEAQAAAAEAQRKAQARSQEDMVKLFCQGIPWGMTLAKTACLDQEALMMTVRKAWPSLAGRDTVRALVLDSKGGMNQFELANQHGSSPDGWSQAAEHATRVYIHT